MSMEAIREKIDQTVTNLKEKRQLLVRHKAQYNDLKFKLMDFQQYKESDKPEIDVKLNSKAIVKGQIVNPQKILVFLGCEYFVERDPTKAIKSVESKLKFLNKAIGEFDVKIKDAKKTIENIGHLEEFERKQKSSASSKKSKNAPVAEEIDQDEEFPFMDIREELDEDGNVIKSSVQKQDDSRINGFAEKAGINENGEIDDYEDQIAELLEDMDIKPKPRFEEIQEEKPKDISSNNEIFLGKTQKKENNDVMSSVVKENDIEDKPKAELQPAAQNKINETHSQAIESQAVENEEEEEDEYYQLMREMGISTKPKNVKSESKPKVETEADVKEIKSSHTEQPQTSIKSSEATTKEIEELPTQSEEPLQPVIEVNGEWGDFNPDQPAIEQDDFIQLQLIADEFEEDGDYDYDEDEQDFEFDEDEEEDDDDDEDWDFSTNPDSLIPDSHRTLFMKELQKIRNQNLNSDKPVNNKDEPVEVEAEIKKDQPKKKKSVSFAPKLQIKQIENVSEQLKNAPDHGKLSKFKQMRVSNGTQPAPFTNETTSSPVTTNNNDTNERPVSDIVIEKDFIEQEIPSEPEPTPKRVSKFKQRNSSSTRTIPMAPNPTINETAGGSLSDIVDKDIIKEEQVPEPSQKVSKFKQRGSSSTRTTPIMSETAGGSLSDIVDKENIEDKPSEPVQKVSKFKQRNSHNTSTMPVAEAKSTGIETAGGSLSDIVEKADIVEPSAPLSKDKVSRFKSSISKPPVKGNAISIPKNDFNYDIENDEYDEFEDIKAYLENEDEDEEDEEALNAITDMDIYTTADINEFDEDQDQDDGDGSEEETGVLTDQIVEHDEVDDPSYFVDDNILQKEYQDLRRKMFAKYMERDEAEIKEKIIPKFNEDEEMELEPIDEHGNPVRVSRFLESLGK
ncbi:Midasin [Wickerhamomyces ciferrii]|uniref:Midasin n=1 Tax=Wickerhamomyces ciferrii (strain ATCC 14091 / BCRC 22168 / CBS 111 / JCM 3599 / NBRC 0793 / NRRL Y-1031 F-60-10) TaxID=1206466 RepID=K0KCW1_WICCF|nr:Midasin [Wickerhamomyces ciferrii]CCH42940.1 Midasin [Wickerhamomyces ciferrii]